MDDFKAIDYDFIKHGDTRPWAKPQMRSAGQIAVRPVPFADAVGGAVCGGGASGWPGFSLLAARL
jgi:hypothetical protein